MSEGAAQRAHAQAAPYSIAPVSAKTGLSLRTRQKYTTAQNPSPPVEALYEDPVRDDDADSSNPTLSEEPLEYGYAEAYPFKPELGAQPEYVAPSNHYNGYSRRPYENPPSAFDDPTYPQNR